MRNKKMMNTRVAGVVLALVLTIANVCPVLAVPVVENQTQEQMQSEEVSEKVVYLDAEAGDDMQDGTSVESAVKTLEKALELLNQEKVVEGEDAEDAKAVVQAALEQDTTQNVQSEATVETEEVATSEEAVVSEDADAETAKPELKAKNIILCGETILEEEVILNFPEDVAVMTLQEYQDILAVLESEKDEESTEVEPTPEPTPEVTPVPTPAPVPTPQPTPEVTPVPEVEVDAEVADAESNTEVAETPEAEADVEITETEAEVAEKPNTEADAETTETGAEATDTMATDMVEKAEDAVVTTEIVTETVFTVAEAETYNSPRAIGSTIVGDTDNFYDNANTGNGSTGNQGQNSNNSSNNSNTQKPGSSNSQSNTGTTQTPLKHDSSSPSNVKTGDNLQILPFSIMAVLSVLMGFAMVSMKVENKRNAFRARVAEEMEAFREACKF